VRTREQAINELEIDRRDCYISLTRSKNNDNDAFIHGKIRGLTIAIEAIS